MSGPRIMFVLPILGGIPITETVTNAWIVMAFIILASLWFTHNMKKVPTGKQVLVEKAVSALYKLVEDTMGADKMAFLPYVGTLFIFSICSNMVGLFGLRAPTADLNTTAGWALIFFILNQVCSVRAHGLKNRLKGFAEPIPLMLPLNLMGEVSTPVSMAFRHFGNIVSGSVITPMIYTALGGLTNLIFPALKVPILALGLPAILSIYFDLFTGVLQAFIICMLTMSFLKMAID